MGGTEEAELGIRVLAAGKACEEALAVACHKLGSELDDIEVESCDSVGQRHSVVLLHHRVRHMCRRDQ